MSSAEQDIFEAELEFDAELRQELKIQRELTEGVQEYALRDDMKGWHAELAAAKNGDGLKEWWPWALAIVLLLGIFVGLNYAGNREVVADEVATILPQPLDTTVVLSEKQVLVEKTPAERPQVQTQDPEAKAQLPKMQPARADSSKFVPPPPPAVVDKTSAKKPLIVPTKMVLVEGAGHRFFIDQYEVTNANYCRFLNSFSAEEIDAQLPQWMTTDPRAGARILRMDENFMPRGGFARRPVTGVTYEGAKKYAKWVGKRLPTASEWSYAARGGELSKGYPYAGGRSASAVSWNQTNAKGRPGNIGKKAPNELNIFDMSGNVAEWLAEQKLIGGSFKSYSDLSLGSLPRSVSPEGREDAGFRCARSIGE